MTVLICYHNGGSKTSVLDISDTKVVKNILFAKKM